MSAPRPLIEDAKTHFVLNSSFSAFDSLLAPGKTTQSPFAAKHTETFVPALSYALDKYIILALERK